MAKAKAKIGRPTVITPSVVKKLIEGFKNDFTVEEACRYARISKETFYQECKRNQVFSDEMDSAQDFPLTLAKKKVVKFLSLPGHDAATMSLKFLERRQRDRYAVKNIQEHQGSVGVRYEELEEEGDRPKTAAEAKAKAEQEHSDLFRKR